MRRIRLLIAPPRPWRMNERYSTSPNHKRVTPATNNHRRNVVLRQNKRLRSTATLAPNVSSEEHNAVGRALLAPCFAGGDDDDACIPTTATFTRKEALERVAVWKIRSPRIGHAIESTAALSQILWRDQMELDGEATKKSGAGPLTTTLELRLSYSCAILRTINGLADTLQQQRSTASSVALLCAELGVPPWLVAIRHEATHNQVPPLPTLRLAANALMQYFSTVYWVPMHLRRSNAYDQAMELLKRFEATAMEDETNKTKQPRNGLEKDDEELPVDEVVSEEDDTSLLDKFGHPLPGTTFNRFALLMDGKPKKKETPNGDILAAPKKEKKKVAAQAPRDPNKPTSLSYTQQFIANMSTADLAYSVALNFLVFGSDDLQCGAMIACEFSVGCGRLRPLLLTLCRKWPGFLAALLMACVDFVCENETRNATEMTSSTVSPCRTLELWIPYLLSRKFMNALGFVQDAGGTEKSKSGLAALSTLKELRLPMNRLCDQLLQASKNGRGVIAKRLATFFSDILATERSANYGIANFDETIDVIRAPTQNVKPSKEKLSLEAMEVFLASEVRGGDTDRSVAFVDEATTKASQIVWVRCNHWEPCAIGSILS